jgi:hypothetical protein
VTAPEDPFRSPPPGGQPHPPPSGQPPPDAAVPPYGGAGQPPPYGEPAWSQPAYGSGAGPRNTVGILALVLGVLSLFSWFFLLGGLLGIAAIVLGVVGRRRARRGEATNGGIALAGIVTGAISVVLTVLMLLLVVSFFGSDEFDGFRECVLESQGDNAAIQECGRQLER